MPLKASGRAGEVQVVDRFAGGVGWIAHPEEGMQRASHALATDEGVWVVDPVDGEGVDDLLAGLGEVAGVAVLLDRHARDAGAIARRHDVPVSTPAWVDVDVDAPTATLDEGPGGYELLTVQERFYWNEAALWDGETLLVPETVGTVDYYCAPGERLGVHPLRRLFPPHHLRAYDPERVLVGHGAGVHADAAAVLDDAIRNARRRTPALYTQSLLEFFR